MPDQSQMRPLPDSVLPTALVGTRTAEADPSQNLRVALRLASSLSDATVLARAADLGRQPLPDRRSLTRAALSAELGPAPQALQAVEAFCQQHGFVAERKALGGLFVTIVGKAGDLARTFGVDLGTYALGDLTFRAHAGPITLPASLVPHVQAVHGLDDVSSLLRQIFRPASVLSTDQPPSIENNLPTTVAYDYYQYPNWVTGKDAIVAFMEDDLAIDVDAIQAFFDSLKIGPVKIVVAQSDPKPIQPLGPSNLNGEAMMDLKLTGSVAPGSTLVAYGLNQDYGFCSDRWIDALLKALTSEDYPCNVMSISLGAPEASYSGQLATSIDFLFAVAGLLGVTVCVASGDFGAPGNICAPAGGKVPPPGNFQSLTLPYPQNCAFPASSSFCLACGGTELLLQSQDGKIVLTDEIVWNGLLEAGQKAATGGGISLLFPVPEFQQSLTLPAPLNPNQGPGRGVPDVASNASNASGYALGPDGKGDGYGTSAAAPFWAALFALLVDANGGVPLGFVNPLLYSLQLAGNTCCKPIVTGNNGPPDSSIVFYAQAPWNACCGLGSPLGTSLANAFGLSPENAPRR
jgi:kumamolisin